MKNVICVLVIYNPTFDILDCNIKAIIDQVDLLWISDNTPGGFTTIKKIIGKYSSKVKYAMMEGNVGIAKAQNAGIYFAIENGFDYIYFLDQDSISPTGVVDRLISNLKELEQDGMKVGGVGPQPYNRDTGKAYLASIKRGHNIKEGLKEVGELINSASLIKVKMLKDVGLMDELLFIDGVDHELCWRAHHIADYRFFMVTSILFSHKLGEGDRKFLGVSVKISTPFRIYYQFRNYFLLLRRGYVPNYWKVSNGVKYFFKYFYYSLCTDQRWAYFNRINKGIFDGLKGLFFI